MQLINTLNQWIDKSNILVIILFGGGIIFTIALKAYNLNFKQIFSALKRSNDKSKDGVTGLQSLMIATSSRIGNGNIAGISSAILIGGPGAIFWMWITALLGMATAFVEGTLAQLYKHKEGDTFVGGAPFYISRGQKSKSLATLYAIIAILTFGGAYMGVQSNVIAANFNTVASPLLPFPSYWIKLSAGIIMGVILIAVAMGGIKSIGKFASAIMPFMGSLYLILALVIIVMNFSKTGEVWKLIFDSAFRVKAAVGGVVGHTMARALQAGAARGVFSNEAGLGSATYAAGAANSKHPIQQGLLQSLSTFIDTIIICSASAFIILYTGVWASHTGSSATLIQASISSQLGTGFAAWIIFIAVFLFGLTTTIGLYYYTETSLRYLTKNKTALKSVQFIIAIYLAISSVVNLAFIWDLASVLTFLLVAINIACTLPQIGTVIALTKDYNKQAQEGKTPVYKNFIKNPDITLWK